MAYRLLTEFERLFADRIYKHRISTHGDWVAIHLFEDLYELGRSKAFRERVDARTRVITSSNRVQGLKSRRGDGTFGDIVPDDEPIVDPGYHVARARTATAAPAFDHFLILRFIATNRPPYPFQWVDPAGLARDYGAMLVRISKAYDERFGGQAAN